MAVRATRLVTCVMILAFAIPFSGVGSGATDLVYKVEYHAYAAAPLSHLGFEGECDTDGVGGVMFCETLDVPEEDRPFKVHMAVEDTVPVPTGGRYEFRGDAGEIYSSGSFCKEGYALVHPNATRLYVTVNINTTQDPTCATPGTSGYTIITWRWGEDPEIAPPHPC